MSCTPKTQVRFISCLRCFARDSVVHRHLTVIRNLTGDAMHDRALALLGSRSGYAKIAELHSILNLSGNLRDAVCLMGVSLELNVTLH